MSKTTVVLVAVAFFGGFIAGIGLEIVLSLIFWFCVGYLAVLAVDLAAGLSEPVCDARVWLRETVDGIWNDWFGDEPVREMRDVEVVRVV